MAPTTNGSPVPIATSKTTNWVQIIVPIVGAVVVALQGVNLSETGQSQHLIRAGTEQTAGNSELIKANSEIAKRIELALSRQNTSLENQTVAMTSLNRITKELINADEIRTAFSNQAQIINQLNTVIKNENELLEKLERRSDAEHP